MRRPLRGLSTVNLHAYETISAVQHGLEQYLMFYNQKRPHRALDGHTPEEVYFDNLPARLTAA
jgi:putative transposase